MGGQAGHGGRTYCLANRKHKHTAYTTGGPFRRESSWALGEGSKLEKMGDSRYQETQSLNFKALLAAPTYLTPPPAPRLGPRTLQEMAAEPHVCVVANATVVMMGGGRTGHRDQSLDQKHIGHASAERGGAGVGLGSRPSVAANQGGDRPSFCKTSLLPRHLCRQQGEGRACHLGSHPLPVVALYPNAPNPSEAWARGRERGRVRSANSLGNSHPS